MSIYQYKSGIAYGSPPNVSCQEPCECKTPRSNSQWQPSELLCVIYCILPISDVDIDNGHLAFPIAQVLFSLCIVACDALCWQGSGSTLFQVMSYCQMAQNHRLNRCWLILIVVITLVCWGGQRVKWWKFLRKWGCYTVWKFLSAVW